MDDILGTLFTILLLGIVEFWRDYTRELEDRIDALTSFLQETVTEDLK